MNSKVNNWAVELEQFKLHLEWIPGSHNLLAESLSHLLDVTPDAQQTEEPTDNEFGSYCFEELEPAKILETVVTEIIELQAISSEAEEDSRKLQRLSRGQNVLIQYRQKTQVKRQQCMVNSESSEFSLNSWTSTEVKTFDLKYKEKPCKHRDLFSHSKSNEKSQDSQSDACVQMTEHKDVKEVNLPLKPRQLQELQKNDTYCRDIAKKLHKNVELQKIFIKENGVLYRLWTEDG